MNAEDAVSHRLSQGSTATAPDSCPRLPWGLLKRNATGSRDEWGMNSSGFPHNTGTATTHIRACVGLKQ